MKDYVFPHSLTRREFEVLTALTRGMTNQQIADELHIEVGTVWQHLNRIYMKLGVKNRSEAISYALRSGLVSLEEEELSQYKKP